MYYPSAFSSTKLEKQVVRLSIVQMLLVGARFIICATDIISGLFHCVQLCCVLHLYHYISIQGAFYIDLCVHANLSKTVLHILEIEKKLTSIVLQKEHVISFHFSHCH